LNDRDVFGGHQQWAASVLFFSVGYDQWREGGRSA
jgi:hypothetical protein